MARLLLTHGRGLSGRDKGYLGRKFSRLLHEGLEAAGYAGFDEEQVEFLYYGDLLDLAQEAPPTATAAIAEAGQRESGEPRRWDIEGDVAHLRRHLDAVAERDAGICQLVEARAGREPSVDEGSDASERRRATESAIEERTAQLLDNPKALLDVLEREFGTAYGTDASVQRRLHELDARMGDDPREFASRKAAEHTTQARDVETVLREWVIDPATDAIASLEAVGRIVRDYGVDVRDRLGEWGSAAWSEALTRFEGTDFGRQWALLFDIIARIAHVTMLDGVFIARRMADVELYFRDASVRNDVRVAYRDAMLRGDGPTILVAHSLGSVIGYDVMREFDDLEAPGLVTLGSPLSIGHFRRNLARSGESADELPVPERVQRWINVYSELDPLVLGSGIERWFLGGGDSQGPGPIDREAENTGYLDAHSPDQYLRSRQTADAVYRMVQEAMRR